MNWMILGGFAIAGIVIALGLMLGLRAFVTLLMICGVVFLFVFGMLYAYWYLFKRREY